MAYTCSYCKTGVMNTGEQYLTHINGIKHKKKAFQLQAPDDGIEYDEFKKSKPAKKVVEYVPQNDDFPSLPVTTERYTNGTNTIEYSNITEKYSRNRPIIVYEDVEKHEDVYDEDNESVSIEDVFFKEGSKVESARYIIQSYIKNQKTAAQSINEIAKAMIWEIEFEPVAAKNARYGVCVLVDNIPFAVGEGENKKEAKQNAAAEAINEIKLKLKKTAEEPKFVNVTKRKEEAINNANDSSADCYRKITIDKFREIHQTCKRHFDMPTRYAAFIITERYDQHAREGTIVAFGAGSGVNSNIEKASIYPGYYIKNFDSLVLARRSLQCFLYNQILMIFDKNRRCNKGEKIFVELSRDGYIKLRPGCRLHLYLSHAPKGDCVESIPKNWTEPLKLSAKEIDRDRLGRMDPIMYMSYSHVTLLKEPGHIRILKENAEDDWISLVNYRVKNKVNANLTLSPTDKLTAWIHLGIQGALLSHLMYPLYIYSIQFGKDYMHEHVSRALLCRVPMDNIINNRTRYYDLIKFSDPYFERISEIRSDRLDQDHFNDLNVSFNWYLNPITDLAEVIDNETGCVHQLSPYVLPGGEERLKCSRLSRVCMLLRVKESIKAAIEFFAMKPEYQRTRYLQGINDACDYNYHGFKSSSSDYRTLKQSLFESLASKHYGEWYPNISANEFNLTSLYEI